MDAYLRKSPKKYIEGVKALKIKGQDLSILDVEYNNNITYEEQFVLQSYTRYKDKFEKQPDETEIPLMLDDVRQKNTSMLAKEIMEEFDCCYVSVFEDNENGAEVYL